MPLFFRQLPAGGGEKYARVNIFRLSGGGNTKRDVIKMENIYDLPTTVEVCGENYEIRSDFRSCLDILSVLDSGDYTESEKAVIIHIIFYVKPTDISKESTEKIIWFLDGGEKNSPVSKPKVYRWEKDRKYIFSGVDKVLGYSCRSVGYLHWWEFLGAFFEIHDSVFNRICYIRTQKQKNKLTKDEKREYNENYDLYCMKTIEEREGFFN